MGNASLGEKLLPACRQTGKIRNLQFLNLSGTGLKFAFCIHTCRLPAGRQGRQGGLAISNKWPNDD